MLRVLSLDDLEAAVAIQSAAFSDDPLWVFLVPNEQQRAVLLRKTFRAALRLGILNAQLYGVGEPLAGIALWTTSTSEVRAGAVLRALPGFAALLLTTRFVTLLPSALKVFPQFSVMQTRYAPDPHYYLETISVAPWAQGKGYASQLIKPFLARADDEGVSAYTETMTPRNVSLYEHYGYRTMETYSVPNTTLKIWAFYRPCQTENSAQ